jgi:uncharacterized protein with PIN domain
MGNSETRRRAAKLRRDQIQAKMPHALRAQDSPPRFVADVMLGKLAKWLRIAGYDVLYSNKFTDDALIALSREEGRILLSLDSRLLVRKRVDRFIFLQGRDLESQLRQILETTRAAQIPAPFSRCLSCNETLISVAAESVRCRVPPYVYRTQSQFKMCPKCGRIFWSGTHRKSIAGILDRVYAGLPDTDAASC